jgi:hypothetical protein
VVMLGQPITSYLASPLCNIASGYISAWFLDMSEDRRLLRTSADPIVLIQIGVASPWQQ